MAHLVIRFGLEGVEPSLQDPYSVFDGLFELVDAQNRSFETRDVEITSEEMEWD